MAVEQPVQATGGQSAKGSRGNGGRGRGRGRGKGKGRGKGVGKATEVGVKQEVEGGQCI